MLLNELSLNFPHKSRCLMRLTLTIYQSFDHLFLCSNIDDTVLLELAAAETNEDRLWL